MGKESLPSSTHYTHEMWILSLGWEGPLEEGMATHSSIFTLENPMDRIAWQATIHTVSQLDMTEATEHVCTK